MMLCHLSQKNDPASKGISFGCMHNSTLSCSDYKPSPDDVAFQLYGLPLMYRTVLQPPCPTELFSQHFVLRFPLCGFLTRVSSENFLHLLCKSIRTDGVGDSRRGFPRWAAVTDKYLAILTDFLEKMG